MSPTSTRTAPGRRSPRGGRRASAQLGPRMRATEDGERRRIRWRTRRGRCPASVPAVVALAVEGGERGQSIHRPARRPRGTAHRRAACGRRVESLPARAWSRCRRVGTRRARSSAAALTSSAAPWAVDGLQLDLRLEDHFARHPIPTSGIAFAPTTAAPPLASPRSPVYSTRGSSPPRYSTARCRRTRGSTSKHVGALAAEPRRAPPPRVEQPPRGSPPPPPVAQLERARARALRHFRPTAAAVAA